MKELFFKVWKDAVWSKVISIGIVGAGAWIWGLIDKQSLVRFIYLIIKSLNYKLCFSVWVFLLLISIFFLLKWLIKKFDKPVKKDARNPLLDETIGEYTFSELYNILVDQKLRERTKKMSDLGKGPPDLTLLQLFSGYRQEFNEGVKNSVGTYNDGGFLIDLLAPKLHSYGLLDRTDEEARNPAFTMIFTTYVTSQAGYKFFDCWEKILAEQSKTR